jgi:hypothetical protein
VGLTMRIFRPLLAACLVLPQVNCAADILPWPGFESQPEIFSYAEQLPAVEVEEQVRCELSEFLRDEEQLHKTDPNEGPFFLDPNKGAKVQLKLTTDLQGSVTYLGINLASLGLGSIATLVTTANNTPSLQLKAQGKTTQTSQVDFVIPQTRDDVVYKKPKTAQGQTARSLGNLVIALGTTISDRDSKIQLSKAIADLRTAVTQLDKTIKAARGLEKFTDLSPEEEMSVEHVGDVVNKLQKYLDKKPLNGATERDEAVIALGKPISDLGEKVGSEIKKGSKVDQFLDITKLPQPVALPISLRLPTDSSTCSHGDPKRFLEYHWFRLWLAKALQQYKKRLEVKPDSRAPYETFADGVCQPSLTITTQFQLLFDISAGSSILQSIPILLPISGLSIDASPDYTHSIQIIFSLRPQGKYDEFGINPRDALTKQRADACSALETTNPPASAR